MHRALDNPMSYGQAIFATDMAVGIKCSNITGNGGGHRGAPGRAGRGEEGGHDLHSAV